MPYHLGDTIAAIASPQGGAARGIVRLSGEGVERCLEACFTPAGFIPLGGLTKPSVIQGSLRSAGLTVGLPCDLYFWPTSKSYTREPAAELHTLGSPPLLAIALDALCAAGARVAEPGEFTLRAFLAGRIDLTQAEAVLGVIDARDRVELECALDQLAGGLARPLSVLRDSLLDLLAHLEAGLDFVEEDIAFIARDELDRELRTAAQAVAALADRLSARDSSAPALRAVLVGWPNVGKSSLFNALARDALALVSSQPGTTRDYLIADLELEGATCRLVDTAGIEPEASQPTAAAAQELRDEQDARANVRLVCIDSTRPLNGWEQAAVSGCGPFDLLVRTRCDLPPVAVDLLPSAIETSSVTGFGLDRLRERLAAAARAVDPGTSAAVAGTATRCRESLRLAADCLSSARDLAGQSAGDELVAAELRVALSELGKVVGAVHTDDLLDRIFSRFCIGK